MLLILPALISSLKKEALHWAHAYLWWHPIKSLTFQAFLKDFLHVFNHPLQQEEAAKNMFSLRQGKRFVSEFAIRFRIIAEESEQEEKALKEHLSTH